MPEPATRAVLWDMDGVLIDSREMHFQSWAAVLAAEGIPFDRTTFQRLFGMNNHDTLAALLGRPPTTAEVARITEAKEALFVADVEDHVHMLPGVLSWLQHFQELGYRQAVASSAPPANIRAVVDRQGIRAFFAALVSAQGLAGKPDPAVFLAAAQRLQMAPARCLVIEDSLAGVEAARRAGMVCLAVETTNPAAALTAATGVVVDLTHLTEELLDSLWASAR